MRTLDISVEERASRTAAEWLWPLVPIGAAVFCLSALIYFRVQYEVVQVRSAMQVMIASIYQAIGFAPAVMFFLLLLTWSSIWFVTGRLDRPLMRIARLLAMAVMMGVFLNLGDGGVAAATHKGVVGAWLAGCLVAAIGYYPSIVLVWAVTFAALLLATDFFFSDSFERLRQRPRGEVGVETAVTDHLRGLGALAAVAEPAPRPATANRDAMAATAVGAPELDFLRELQVDEPPLAGAAGRDDIDRADEEEAFTPRRRRSYFDRRRAEEEQEHVVERAIEQPEQPERIDVDVTTAAEWGPEAAAIAPANASVAPTVDDQLADDEDDRVDRRWHEDERMPAAPQQSFVAIEEAPSPTSEHEREVVGRAAGADDEVEVDDEIEVEGTFEIEPEVEVEAELAEVDSIETAGAAAADEAKADSDDDAESLVSIPRPDQTTREWQAPSAPRTPARQPETPVRQQKLFAAEVDEDLLEEALEVVSGQSRVTAVLLQRRLRIDYQQAMEVLRQLGARGVLELDADATQGRVVV